MDASGQHLWDRLLAAGTDVPFRKRDVILHEGAPPTHVVLLISGRVKVLRNLSNGKVLLLSVREVGEILGVIGVVGQSPRSATVVALTPCRTRILPADRFRSLTSAANGEAELLRHAMNRICEGETWRAETAALQASPRVIRALLRLAFPGEGGCFELDLNQTEIGQAVGLSRSMVAAELARLRARGVLSTIRRRIIITDMPRLRSLADTGHDNV